MAQTSLSVSVETAGELKTTRRQISARENQDFTIDDVLRRALAALWREITTGGKTA